MRARQFSIAVMGLLLAAVLAPAQTDAGNGVARVSLMRGDVTVQRGDSGELTEAAINAPLVTGDRMLTGPGSRAELQFDYAHFLRLDANSEVRMLELRPERYLVAVAEGTVAFSRIDQFDSEVEVNTPSVSVRPVQRGNFRVTVFPDGSSEISVRDGQVEVYTPAGVERLGPGRTMLARGDRDNPEFQYVKQARRDDFDNWNRDRDRLIRRSESYQYVDRSVPGAYELDAYGSWVNVAPYGMVWRPRVAGGWAPYRHGRWAWVDYYGWNWVSYDPWGWAPFHYGRWFHSAGVGWYWYPGGFGRQFYSPAVVGWFGLGGVGVGFGNVGWVPLAPYEPFYPWWGGRWGGYYRGGWRNNRTFVDNSVNIVNNTNITNVYRNARVGNGFTVVDGQNFARGASVRHNGAPIESLRTASSVRGRLPVAPERSSLRFSDRGIDRGQLAGRLARTEGRQFHTRTAPTPVDRASFETQRGAMEQVQRQAFSRGGSAEGGPERQSARGQSAVVGGDTGSRAATRGVSAGPGQRDGRGAPADFSGSTADAPTRGSSSRGPAVSGDSPVPDGSPSGRTSVAGQRGASAESTDSRGGWRRFGEPVTRQGADRGATANRGASAGTDGNFRGGSTPTRGASNGANGAGATSRSGDSSRGANSESDSGSSWRRFGEPTGRGNSARGDSATSGGSRGKTVTRGTESTRGSTDQSGWRSFGRGSSSQPQPDSTRGAVSSRGSERGSQAPSTERPTPGGDSSSSSRGGAATRGSSGSGASRGAASPQRLNVSPPIVRQRSEGSTTAPASGGRGTNPGVTSTRGGTTNRGSADNVGWQRFGGGTASSGVQVYGSTRSSASPSTYSNPSATRSTGNPSRTTAPRSWRSFSGSAGGSRNNPYAGSSRSGSGSTRSTAPAASGNYGRSSGSFSSGSSRSAGAAPGSRNAGSYRSPSASYGGSRAGRSAAPSIRQSGSYNPSTGSSRSTIGGSSRSSGSFGGASRGGGVSRSGGSVSRGGSSMGGRSGGGISGGSSRGSSGGRGRN